MTHWTESWGPLKACPHDPIHWTVSVAELHRKAAKDTTLVYCRECPGIVMSEPHKATLIVPHVPATSPEVDAARGDGCL